MPLRLNPYLRFDGNARDAMTLYADVFGGELSVMTFGQMGAEGDIAEQVMHSQLETPDGFTLMGSDQPPGIEMPQGNVVSLSGEDEQKLRGWWDRLAEGGTVTTPLERQMWGDVFGQLDDRFGVAWLVNISTPQ